VADTDTHATRKTTLLNVSRICFALNNSTSSRRKDPFKLAYIPLDATSEPRATLVDNVLVHRTPQRPHLCW